MGGVVKGRGSSLIDFFACCTFMDLPLFKADNSTGLIARSESCPALWDFRLSQSFEFG